MNPRLVADKGSDLLDAERTTGERDGDFVAAHLAQGDLNDLRERGAIKNACEGVPHIQHQYAQAAVCFVRAGAATVSGLADASDGGERTVEQANDGAEFDPAGRFGKGVAAEFSSFCFDVTSPAQLGEDLFDEFDRQLLFGDEFADLENGAAELTRDSKINQGPEGIFAAFGQVHL